jgi:hypothetical protein
LRKFGVARIPEAREAARAGTSVARLEELARHADPRVRAAAASNAGLTGPLLEQLAGDVHAVRIGLAANRALPLVIAQALAGDANKHVRNSLACTTTSLAVLDRLADDDDFFVVGSVVANPAFPFTRVHEVVSRPRMDYLRYRVFERTDLTDEQLVALIRIAFFGTDTYESRWAVNTLLERNVLGPTVFAALTVSRAWHWALLGRADLPVDALTMIARAAIAEVDEEDEVIWSREGTNRIVYRIAEHPSSSTETLQVLLSCQRVLSSMPRGIVARWRRRIEVGSLRVVAPIPQPAGPSGFQLEDCAYRVLERYCPSGGSRVITIEQHDDFGSLPQNEVAAYFVFEQHVRDRTMYSTYLLFRESPAPAEFVSFTVRDLMFRCSREVFEGLDGLRLRWEGTQEIWTVLTAHPDSTGRYATVARFNAAGVRTN